jgi:putative component of membrane protein insertase Oxa1/YidC/SpoIIIJ protein YidD
MCKGIKRKWFAATVFFLFLICTALAQQPSLLAFKKNSWEGELTELRTIKSTKAKKGLGNALLTIYQKHISAVIAADCLYALSCSRYSREAINKYGLVSGVLLTADRLTRCAFSCSKDIPHNKFNKDGLAEDNP